MLCSLQKRGALQAPEQASQSLEFSRDLWTQAMAWHDFLFLEANSNTNIRASHGSQLDVSPLRCQLLTHSKICSQAVPAGKLWVVPAIHGGQLLSSTLAALPSSRPLVTVSIGRGPAAHCSPNSCISLGWYTQHRAWATATAPLQPRGLSASERQALCTPFSS